jgi:signal transduction histidine kinase
VKLGSVPTSIGPVPSAARAEPAAIALTATANASTTRRMPPRSDGGALGRGVTCTCIGRDVRRAGLTRKDRGRQLKRAHPYSIRTKLLLFAFALVTVPGTLVGMVAFRMASGALVARAGQQLTVLARDVGAEMGEDAAEQRVNVEAWARQEVMRDIVVDDIDKRISKFLTSITASYPGYLELFVTTPDGRAVASTDPGRIGATYRPATPPRGADDPVWQSAHGRLVLELSTTVPDPEAPEHALGVLVAHYDWAQVMALTGRMRQGLTGSGLSVDFVILDDRMRLLGGTAPSLSAPPGTTLGDLGWGAAAGLAARGRPGFALEPALDAVVAYVPASLDPPAWRTLAIQARTQALEPAYRMRWRVALVLLIVLGIALGLGALLAERMIRPLRVLTAATRQLAATGELAEPIPVQSADEIGELSAAFNTAATDLRRARDDLVAASKLAFVGELAAGMAHEIRTPLGILRSSAQMLGRTSDGATAERRELVDMLIGEVDRLDRVVTGLTDLARPRRLAVQPTPLNELLGRALDFAAGRALEKGIALRRMFDDGPCIAHCDPDEIYQVVLNLVVNALQVTPHGGTIVARTFAPRDGRVGFEVTDTGPGLSPERQAQIFTPFVSFREGGTGLGLAVAQRTVLAHGGTIAVRSTPGHGATFTVELPAFGGTR